MESYWVTFVYPFVAPLLGFAPASQNFDYGLPAKFRFQAFAQGDTKGERFASLRVTRKRQSLSVNRVVGAIHESPAFKEFCLFKDGRPMVAPTCYPERRLASSPKHPGGMFFVVEPDHREGKA